MRLFMVAAGCLLLGVISGCGSFRPTGGMKIDATSIEDFEKQANRLCPYGYDILGEPEVFAEGQSNSRFIHCRHNK